MDSEPAPTAVPLPGQRDAERAIGSGGDGVAALLARRWRWLALAALLGGGASALADWRMPSYYRSQAKLAVLPAVDPVTSAGMNALDGANATLPVLAALLQSRGVALEVVRRLGLASGWHARSEDAAIAELLQRVSVVAERRANTNLVTVTAEDRVPARARDIARAVAEVASARNVELWSARIREERRRMEGRFDEVSRELAASEESMRRFQERHHVVDLPAQIKATVDQAAALQSARIDKQLGLHYARGFGGGRSDEVRRAERERSGVEAELEPLLRGTRPEPPLLPFNELPALEQEQQRLQRAVEVDSARYALLARQVEQLRAAEAGPAGRVEMLDEPALPSGRSRPGRPAIGVAGALCAAALLGVLLSVGRGRWR